MPSRNIFSTSFSIFVLRKYSENGGKEKKTNKKTKQKTSKQKTKQNKTKKSIIYKLKTNILDILLSHERANWT